MTGILAALKAHEMGVRRIELHERLDEIGGIARPRLDDLGREMREGCIYFGPDSNPIRSLLERHGVRFDEFANKFGSVSPSANGASFALQDFGGPALEGRGLPLVNPVGHSLESRLTAYPNEIARSASKYAQWHLGCDLTEIHASAAVPLAINRIYPRGEDRDHLAAVKRVDPLADEMLAIPRSLWGRTENLVASLPRGGFCAMLKHLQTRLSELAIDVRPLSHVRPANALERSPPDEVTVWAGSPLPLFKTVGIKLPKLLAKRFATYVFEASWDGALPFYVQNFTAQGVCFRTYLYESNGHTLLTAECVETGDDSVGAQIHALCREFGNLRLGKQLFRSIGPRWIYHTVETIERLHSVRDVMANRHGDRFVAGAWEEYAKDAKFDEVTRALEGALG